MSTIFGREHFIDRDMIIQKMDTRIIELIANTMEVEANSPGIRQHLSVSVSFVLNKEKFIDWINLCVQLENIDKSELIDIATRKKFEELKKDIWKTTSKTIKKQKTKIKEQAKTIKGLYKFLKKLGYTKFFVTRNEKGEKVYSSAQLKENEFLLNLENEILSQKD